MFKIKESQTFTWPVKAKVPEDGKYKTVQFMATFNILSSERMAALAKGDEDGDVLTGSLRILREALVSFDGIDVEDAEGNLLTEDEERNDLILRYPFFVSALSDAYAAGVAGYRAKN